MDRLPLLRVLEKDYQQHLKRIHDGDERASIGCQTCVGLRYSIRNYERLPKLVDLNEPIRPGRVRHSMPIGSYIEGLEKGFSPIAVEVIETRQGCLVFPRRV